jgi:hypothetical protein
MQTYVIKLQRWLTEMRIAMNVSKESAIIFARVELRFIQSRSLTHLVEPIKWVHTTRYLCVTSDKRFTWSPHIDQVRRRTAQRMGLLFPFLSRSELSIRNGILIQKQQQGEDTCGLAIAAFRLACGQRISRRGTH